MARAVKHIVLFKFKEGTGAEIIKKMGEDAEAMVEKIPTLKALLFRESFSGERGNGFTHLLDSTLTSDEGLKEYIVHENHQEFLKKYKPIFEDAMAMDYYI